MRHSYNTTCFLTSMPLWPEAPKGCGVATLGLRVSKKKDTGIASRTPDEDWLIDNTRTNSDWVAHQGGLTERRWWDFALGGLSPPDVDVIPDSDRADGAPILLPSCDAHEPPMADVVRRAGAVPHRTFQTFGRLGWLVFSGWIFLVD